MYFRSVILALAFLATEAKTLKPSKSINVNSKGGKNLMEKARKLNDERDVTFVANYSIKYRGCSSLVQIGGGDGDGDGGEGSTLYTQNLVKFSLCPTDSCEESCNGGADYVVNMMDFVNAYTENKMNALEQACETIRENCYCNDDYQDEDVCETQCFTDAEMTECIQYEGEDEFEVQEYLECAEMEDNNNNNNNNNYNYGGGNGDNYYGAYYIGPYCSPSDGYSINLGVFYDEGCSSMAPSSAYSDRNYGSELPYASEAMVESDCLSCQDVDEDNNNNNNNNNNGNNNGNDYYYYYQELEVNEMCGEVYEQAAKCEQSMDVNWPDSTGCDYINNILPRLESATRNIKNRSSGGGAAIAFAWIFAISTVLFGSYAFFLYRKLDRNRVDLSSSDGALA